MNSAKSFRLARTLDALWYACSAPQTLIALATLLAGALAFAALVPQQDVLNRPWLRGLLAALAFNLALRAAAQARYLISLRRPVQLRPAPAGLPLQRSAFPAPLAAALARAEAALHGRFSRVASESDTTHAQLYAERGRLGAAGPLLAYGGALALLAGLAIDAAAGWRTANLFLAPGNTATLSQAPGLQVTVTEITGGANGAGTSLTLARDGAGKAIRIGYARPARWGNLWLTQQATGPALAVSATDQDQHPLLLQSLAAGGAGGETLRVLFQQAQSEQAFAIPDRNLAFRVVSYAALPERGIGRPVYLVEGYRGDDPAPALSELVEDAGTLTLDKVTLALRRDRYAEIRAAYLPGLPPVLAGALLLLAGALLSARRGPVRLWAALAATAGTVTAAVHTAAAADAGAEAEHLLGAISQDAEGAIHHAA